VAQPGNRRASDGGLSEDPDLAIAAEPKAAELRGLLEAWKA